MTNQLMTIDEQQAAAIVTMRREMGQLTRAADLYTAATVIKDYFDRKSEGTRRARHADVDTFTHFLNAGDIDTTGCNFQQNAACWSIVTHGLLTVYVKWMLDNGYSTESINRKLSTVKIYCKMATKSGELDPAEMYMIGLVTGYSGIEGQRIDETREQTRQPDTKKAKTILLTPEQAAQLMEQPNTAQGRRDRVLLTILLEHGLRVSELAILTNENLAHVEPDTGRKVMQFHRPKVAGSDKERGRHIITAPTLAALKDYPAPTAAADQILRASSKGGHLGKAGMSTRSISIRVGKLAERIGVPGLSSHDCRHYCATVMSRKGYSVAELMEWFGWTNPRTAMRYVEAQEQSERYKG